MDDGLHIIIQSYHFYKLKCNLKFPAFQRICTRIIFDHKASGSGPFYDPSGRNVASTDGVALGLCPVVRYLKKAMMRTVNMRTTLLNKSGNRTQTYLTKPVAKS
ncbi:hypothetical protein TNCV_2870551 [Trichonephila clavipes]|nr:hypothetical protein TNCV_2870551 [Trichonephila clavipes]